METLKPRGQLDLAYRVPTLPCRISQWQAESKVDAILLADGEKPNTLSLGDDEITLNKKPPHTIALGAEGLLPQQKCATGAADQ